MATADDLIKYIVGNGVIWRNNEPVEKVMHANVSIYDIVDTMMKKYPSIASIIAECPSIAIDVCKNYEIYKSSLPFFENVIIEDQNVAFSIFDCNKLRIIEPDTGVQNINTNIIFNDTYKYDINFIPQDDVTTILQAGSNWAQTPNTTEFCIWEKDGIFRIRGLCESTRDFDIINKNETNIYLSKSVCKQGNVTMSTNTYTCGISGYEIYIGHSLIFASASNIAKIKRFIIKDGSNNIIHFLIPIERNGIIGMVDLINNSFVYTNQTSGTCKISYITIDA